MHLPNQTLEPKLKELKFDPKIPGFLITELPKHIAGKSEHFIVGMAMKQLVEGECGGANPLMGMVSHFTQDKARHQDGFNRDGWQSNQRYFQDATEDQLVREYLQGPRYEAAPQSFRMDQLLNEMQEIEHLSGPPAMHPVHQDPRSEEWAREFLASHPSHDEVSSHWVDEYSRHQVAGLDDNASNSINQQHDTHSKWADEYLENAIDSSERLKQTAREILDKVEDEDILNTEFMKTVESISKGDRDKHREDRTEDQAWVEEYAQENKDVNMDAEAQKWIDEYALNEEEVDYWQKLQQEWDELSSQDPDNEHPWLRQYTNEQNKDYTFEEENPFKDHPNAFEEGLAKLKEGDLISAILLFEEAVRAEPEHAEAWQYLGTSQAENEQESLAISALNRCCDLQPDNLTARMALAVSYTNESLQLQACESLKAWLRHHPKYKDLVPDIMATPATRVTSLMTKAEFDQVNDLFIEAAQIAPDGNIDADVQVGLGVLFNLSGDYDKAVDCFNTGLQSRQSDPYIWNKLGATLANSGRSEEAVQAYRNALHLNPAYNRARYNLGISCLNLGAHVEAVEHFLTALNMQRKGESPSGTITTMSDNIWSTLRMTISLMGKSELMPVIERRDLERLNQEFNMHRITS